MASSGPRYPLASPLKAPIMDDLTYIVSLEGMQGLAFFGYHVNEPAMPFRGNAPEHELPSWRR